MCKYNADILQMEIYIDKSKACMSMAIRMCTIIIIATYVYCIACFLYRPAEVSEASQSHDA